MAAVGEPDSEPKPTACFFCMAHTSKKCPVCNKKICESCYAVWGKDHYLRCSEPDPEPRRGKASEPEAEPDEAANKRPRLNDAQVLALAGPPPLLAFPGYEPQAAPAEPSDPAQAEGPPQMLASPGNEEPAPEPNLVRRGRWRRGCSS